MEKRGLQGGKEHKNQVKINRFEGMRTQILRFFPLAPPPVTSSPLKRGRYREGLNVP